MRLDLERRLAALPDRLREVLVLRYYRDLGEREIAELLAIPPGTVKSRLHAAVRALRGGEERDVSGADPRARGAPRGAARSGGGAERRARRAHARGARAELRAGRSALLARAGSARRARGRRPPPLARRQRRRRVGGVARPLRGAARLGRRPRRDRCPALYAFGALGWLGVFFGALPFVAHQRLVRRLREVPT